MAQDAILVINSGSSSLKFGLFLPGTGDERMLVDGTVDGVATAKGSITLKDADGKEMHAEAVEVGSQVAALGLAATKLAELKQPRPVAIGHRVVHGGPRLLDHCEITPSVVQTLKDSVHFAPLHIPPALELIEEAQKRYPGVPQYACFDTTFHETMPEDAKLLPIPHKYFDEGVRRYGFHGLSYASIVHALGKDVPERLVVAHLGSGCSVAAIRRGRSVDTTMGLTPAGGIVMATRAGDLDPGVLIYLLRNGLDVDGLETLVNHGCGLKGLTGHSDVREVSGVALDVFYRSAAKAIASFASVLGGIDLLVFTGGIGQHSQEARAAILGRLEFLSFAVKAMPAEEELQIARICRGLLE